MRCRRSLTDFRPFPARAHQNPTVRENPIPDPTAYSPFRGRQATKFLAPHAIRDRRRGEWVRAWGEIALWDVSTGKEQVRLTTGQGEVESLAFSPDGKRQATRSADGTTLVWDLGVVLAPRPRE